MADVRTGPGVLPWPTKQLIEVRPGVGELPGDVIIAPTDSATPRNLETCIPAEWPEGTFYWRSPRARIARRIGRSALAEIQALSPRAPGREGM
jgi:hypothetical protein